MTHIDYDYLLFTLIRQVIVFYSLLVLYNFVAKRESATYETRGGRMKGFTAKSLVAVSRYQNYFPTLSAELQRETYTRIEELIQEEQHYCDKGNYEHMAQILTSIALYEVSQNHGASEEEAYRTVSEQMWAFLDPSGMQKRMSTLNLNNPTDCDKLLATLRANKQWADDHPQYKDFTWDFNFDEAKHRD